MDGLCSLPLGGGAAIRVLARGVLTRGGIRISLESPLVGNRTVAQLFWGFYESGERRMILKHLNPNLSVVKFRQ